MKQIDAGGALNNGLISYSAGGAQYVAAAVGGSAENPSTVAGPLRVVVYGLGGPDTPTVVTLDRVPPSAAAGLSAGRVLYVQACAQCHANPLTGGSAPQLMRQSQLADPELLKRFLSSVPPPMPRLYPGVVNDDDVRLLAEWFRTDLFKCGSPDALQSGEAPRQPTSGGTKEWQAIYSVLTSPRCMNCHPVASPKLPLFLGLFPQDYPRQGDDRHPHYYSVVRGETNSVETAEKTGHVESESARPSSAARCAMAGATTKRRASRGPRIRRIRAHRSGVSRRRRWRSSRRRACADWPRALRPPEGQEPQRKSGARRHAASHRDRAACPLVVESRQAGERGDSDDAPGEP